MTQYTIEVRIELLSETIISSGHSVPGGEDISLRLDAAGRPFLPGSTLKGLLRESMQDLLVWQGRDDEALIAKLFGEEGCRTDDERRLAFGMLRLEAAGDETVLRAFTGLTEGRVTEAGTLRVAASLRRGLVLKGSVCCAEEDAELTEQALRAIKWIGLHRNRGFGRVRVTTVSGRTASSLSPIASARCLHYRLRLDAPFTAAEQHGSVLTEDRKNYVETRRWIPGSAVRGWVISSLAAGDPAWFEAHRRELLGSGVRFLNALPTVGAAPSIPTPAGFFEDKAQTRFYSVLTREVVPGDKRAGLGEYCRINEADRTELICGSPRTSASLRILRTGEKKIFNAEAIAEGTEFDGYILLEDPSMAEKISAQLCGVLRLGADRFAGSGLCTVTALEAREAPHWAELSAEPDTTLYLMLLSPTVLCRDGEICGMDETVLAGKLGVDKVEILRCATSITEVQGFNRTLGVWSPALPMYTAGSVFRLCCSQAPTAEAMRRLEREGLGLRRSEGFGQVLFLRGYETLSKYKKYEPAENELASRAAGLRRARAGWLLSKVDVISGIMKMKNGLSASQIGSIQAICEQSLAAAAGRGLLEEYFTHKAIAPRQERAFREMRSLIDTVLDRPLDQTLGCPVPDDGCGARMSLLIDLMNLSRKGGREG